MHSDLEMVFMGPEHGFANEFPWGTDDFLSASEYEDDVTSASRLDQTSSHSRLLTFDLSEGLLDSPSRNASYSREKHDEHNDDDGNDDDDESTILSELFSPAPRRYSAMISFSGEDNDSAYASSRLDASDYEDDGTTKANSSIVQELGRSGSHANSVASKCLKIYPLSYKGLLAPIIKEPRVPLRLQAVFLASSRGEVVHIVPSNGVANKVFERNFIRDKKSASKASRKVAFENDASSWKFESRKQLTLPREKPCRWSPEHKMKATIPPKLPSRTLQSANPNRGSDLRFPAVEVQQHARFCTPRSLRPVNTTQKPSVRIPLPVLPENAFVPFYKWSNCPAQIPML
jgi:hypothetical protein